MTSKIRFAALLLSALLICTPGLAQKKKTAEKKEDKTEKKDSTATKKKNKLEDILKKQTSCCEGMFTVRISDGKVYFQVPDSLLGREFVMGSTIKSVSDNGNGVVGSKPLTLKHFTFVKRDSTLLMKEIEAGYIANDKNIGRALSKSNIGSIAKAFELKAWAPDSCGLYDVTSIFLEHDKEMSPFIEYASYAGYERNESFKKDLSFIESAKAFSDNVSVTSSMSYTYTMKGRNGKNIFKDKPFTAELTRTILLLPREVYHPRAADYRIGFFNTERKQLGATLESGKTVHLANRWRLEPSDTAAFRRGEKVEPVKPIVFYIDSNFPEWWKPYIREAVEQWQEPFERIGFKNAVVARDFPTDDPEFDPDNIKYSCVRYAPIGVQNAMGPSWVDPRSGEIITASVYVYHDAIKLLGRWMFAQTAQADERVRGVEIPRDLLGDGLRYVIAHEVGHCLGLMHNMSASSVIPVESLRDPEFTQKYGTTTSIMDYARFNYVAQPGDKERGVRLTPPRFGFYDYYAIRWGYTPVFDAPSFEAEEAVTSGWITDSLKANPWYRYGKQQMYSVYYDPSCQSEDLGDDVVKATRYGVQNLKYITANFMDWAAGGDDEYETRMLRYNTILNQYLTYVQHVLLNIGGLYKYEVKYCDAQAPFENIPRARQIEALRYLFELQEDLSWVAPQNVVSRLPIVGSPEKSLRSSIQDLILLAPAFAGTSDGSVTKEFSCSECLEMIHDYVWEPTRKGKKLTDGQRAFQRSYVQTMMANAGLKYPGQNSNAIQCNGEQICPENFEGEPTNLLGTLTYSPVNGYEWLPRAIFNVSDYTQSLIYGDLCQVYKTIKKKAGGASGEDKAHYQLLLKALESGLAL